MRYFDDFRAQKSQREYFLVQGKQKFALHVAHLPHPLRHGARVRVQGYQLDQAIIAQGGQSIQTPVGGSAAPLNALGGMVSSLDILNEPPDLPPVVGAQRLAVLLFNFRGADRNTKASDLSKRYFGSVNAYYQGSSYQQVSVTGDLFGYFTISMRDCGNHHDSDACGPLLDSIAALVDEQAIQAGVDLTSYDQLAYVSGTGHGRNGGQNGWGVASTPGKSWIFGGDAVDILEHEYGHSINLAHARTINCGSRLMDDYARCAFSEYGDTYEVMGSGSGPLNAPHRVSLGWIPPERVLRAFKNDVYHIAPIEVTSSGFQTLKIRKRDTNEFYFVEYRPSASGESSIRIWDGYRGNATTRIANVSLTPGATFFDPVNHLTISQVNRDSTGATFSVTYGGQPDLAIDTPARSPELPQSQDVITFTAIVRNQGAGMADPTTAALHLIRDDGVEVATIVQPVPLLGVDEPAQLTFQWTAMTGNYTYRFCADHDAVVTESDENNNCSDVFGLNVPRRVDLLPTAINPIGELILNQPVVFAATVRNQGSDYQAGATGMIFTVDHGAWQKYVELQGSTIPAGREVTLLADATWTAAPLGEHVVTFCVDPPNSPSPNILEDDETNNCLSEHLKVVPQTDLVVSPPTLSDNSPKATEQIVFTGVVQNVGAGILSGFTSRLCMDSANGDACLGDPPQHEIYYTGTPPLHYFESSIVATRPWTVTTGHHTVYFCVDPGNVIAEANKHNNCASTTFDVQDVGKILIERRDTQGNLLASPATKAWVVSRFDASFGTRQKPSNPATWPSLASGTYAMGTDRLTGYTIRVGTCQYNEVATNDCTVTDFSTVSCGTNAICWSPDVSVTASSVSKIVFEYTPVGDLRVERMRFDGGMLPTTTVYLDPFSGVESAQNPAAFSGVTAGLHSVAVNELAGYTMRVGSCQYVLGSATDCTVPNFVTPRTCAWGVCSTNVQVTVGMVTKIVGQYTITTTQPSTFALSGTIQYYVAPQGSGSSAPSPVPVRGVTVQLSGANVPPVTTDANGTFTFPNVPKGGPYTLTPSKSGDLGTALGSLDAAKILQDSIGLLSPPLTQNQRWAADVTGDGTRSALDAAKILQHIVGLLIPDTFSAAEACQSDWLFVPTPASGTPPRLWTTTNPPPALPTGHCQMGAITYPSLSADTPTQDFTAILLGDVSGNWAPTP